MSNLAVDGTDAKAQEYSPGIHDHDDHKPSKYTTRRMELWSYYLYYIGNNGLSGFNFGPSQFQNLLFLAGYDPMQPPFTTGCNDNGCVLPYLGKTRDINSIVLLTNGISFAIQAVLLLVIGAWADYGRWRPNITIVFTLVAVAVSFAWLGVEDPPNGGALTFWTAAFPALARDLPEVQQSLAEMHRKEKTLEAHDRFTSLSRNRISNISFAISSAGEIVILAVMSTENNTKGFSVLIAFAGGVWFLCALPWFFLEKRRPGLSLPPGTNLLTIGAKQVYVAFRECMNVVAYSTLQLTLLLIVGIFTQGLGVYLFWLVQKRFKISTKAILTIWGLIGIHTDRFGFKHVWEIWLYQAFYGLMVCPWYAYSQTMISEAHPLIFCVVGKTSAFIGPFVSSAIITAADNNDNMPFAFLFALGVFSTIFLWMVDVDKSRIECEEFVLAEEARKVFQTGEMELDLSHATSTSKGTN
ncbi:autophagy-related protein 22-like protein [Infundibulicybe gibba]|nr:autophagy-related protein 22-like protein [Infundibulicybe gibba]